MFTAAKDALTSATARKFISTRIARYGEVRDLRIDSKQKTVAIVCDLVGEAEPIEVSVGRYELEQVAGKDYVRVHRCRCNRPWLTNLLEDFVEGKRFEVPPWVKTAL